MSHFNLHPLWILFLSAVLLSAVLTGLMRHYAQSRNLLDRPNQRSSHVVPTPRGGGVAVVAVFLAGLVMSEASAATASALIGGGIGIALVGFIDDHGHIPARWRLLAHFSCAAWILFWLEVPQFEWMGATIDLGMTGAVLAVLYLVWMLNLYNFMDGIDGIAGIEAVTVGTGAATIALIADLPAVEIQMPLLLAAAATGFLIWNFPPAKIFMGDTGSGFIGLMLGALSLQAAIVRAELLWCWLVLLGVFIVDATVTLIRRLLRGDRIYEAHRIHAYQHASREFGRHWPVTLAVATINIFWLLPWAALIATGGIDGVVGLVVAYIPLLALALRFKAGKAI